MLILSVLVVKPPCGCSAHSGFEVGQRVEVWIEVGSSYVGSNSSDLILW